MLQNKYNGAPGFTLVELAIVITIIGILIGGVLKGQQLVDQARMAATMSEVQNYRTAVSIFKTTYNELPGDMMEPDERIVGCNNCAATSGTLGDGGINTGWRLAYTMTSKDTEKVRAWLHLMKAGMISGVSDAAVVDGEPIAFGSTHPASKMGGGYVIQTGTGQCGIGDANAKIWAGNCVPYGLTLMIRKTTVESYRKNGNTAIFTPQQAAQLDRKMDDGKPRTGDVHAVGNGYCGRNTEEYEESATDKPSCSFGFIIDK